MFKIKDGNHGQEKKIKARLCVRGFKQRSGVDFEETFVSVVRYVSLRMLLSVAVHLDLENKQFDVKTAFLYGELKVDIYIQVPRGLNVGAEEKDCKLNKSLG